MFRRARAAAVFAAVGLGVGLALTGCSSGGDEPSDTSENVLPPVMVQLDEVDGTTVEVPLDNVIVLQGDDETFTAWEADIADPSIAEFTPGKDDGSATFDPGITPRKVGSTEVTLDNSESGDTVSFTVEVIEAG
ncbi:hypothetical protein FLP10_08015 [Agromyces intestinalis]|uniref:MSP domain-containing protein n=1 Tax=Agromyces intestinalis TaxID=2592652 RepID=A0A5C1YGZ9_9MICO|nr:hypothetical protein [Agromyces intestinalis]QEO14369.1 hypothetical protein FLP10_08015 [Agromyces intestinalis]